MVLRVAPSWYLDTNDERNVAAGSDEATSSRDLTVDFCAVPERSYRLTKPSRNDSAPASALEFPKALVELEVVGARWLKPFRDFTSLSIESCILLMLSQNPVVALDVLMALAFVLTVDLVVVVDVLAAVAL